jgi:hypothetical protein
MPQVPWCAWCGAIASAPTIVHGVPFHWKCLKRRAIVLGTMNAHGADFQEIGHCGGNVIVRVTTDEQGRRGVQVTIQNSSPTPASWFAVYALPQGIPVAMIELGGIGDRSNAPPYPNCLSVFIGSDSRGLFGHQCPSCNGYWRSTAVPARWDLTCPYCGISGATHQFLTPGHQRYVEAVCRMTMIAIESGADGEHVIDLDNVADEVVKTGERPAFYYTEEKQQNHYKCGACGIGDDILGRYGYCSFCGTRNDLQELTAIIEGINEQTRARIAAGQLLEGAVPDAVSAFDSVARQYAKQLAKWVPMIRHRREALETGLFHNLRRVEDLKPWFGIDVFEGLDSSDRTFIRLMFCRRHVYEHNGGEVDQKYLNESGDTTVRLKQTLHETSESVFRMTKLIIRLARNLHNGFHELFPPREIPLQMHKEQRERLERYKRGG